MKINLTESKYKTKQWKAFRLSILSRDEYTCQECKRKGKRTTANTVHHIEMGNEELFYVKDNLISVCAECHNSFHDRNIDELTDAGKRWQIRRRRGLIGK